MEGKDEIGTICPATTNSMEEFERELCDRNDDDWFVPQCSLDWIAEIEYNIYMRECGEEREIDNEEVM